MQTTNAQVDQPGRFAVRLGNLLRRSAFIVATAALLATLAAPLTAQAAVSAGQLTGMDTDQAKELFGTNVERDHYVLLPSDDPGPNTKPSQLGVIICFQSAESCTKSSGNGQDGLTFRFTKMHHYDRGGGVDSWDFIFTPELNGKPLDSRLAFIYRSNAGGAGGSPDSWGIVNGDPGDGLEVSDNRVAGLEAFGDTPFAEKLLDSKSNDEGVKWAKAGKVDFSESQSDFADRAVSDPFQNAVEKMTEVVNSLSNSISDALVWALDQGELKPGIRNSWMVIRDLINVLFVIVMVAMALMTIVRLDAQKYNVRSLLPILIFAVITVNFSLFFAEIMLNTATVLSQPFLEQAKRIVEFGGESTATFTSTASFGDSVVMLVAALIMMIALAILLFFFVIRIIVIWLLAAASPVLFLFMVLPLTRGEASKLLTQWIRWVYMAPISFILLYVGANAGFLENTGEPNTSGGLLEAIFYAGLVIAAVAIPMALGGRIMAMLANRAAGAAKLGGKAGLGVGMMAPAGGGKTIGQRKREAAAFLKQRKDSQEQDAALNAAQSRLALGEAFNQLGPVGQSVGTTVTGMSQGQQVAALEAIVAQAQKEMVPLGMAAKMRIANAHKYGTRQIGGETFANTAGGDYIPVAMDSKEQALANNRINAAAAFRELAQAEFADPHLVSGPNSYAWTGYQQLHKTDPVVSSHERGGRINEKSLAIKSQLMSPDDLRGLDGNVIDGAMNRNAQYHREYLKVMRNIDSVRLGDAVDSTARNKMHDASKRQRIYQMAKSGMFSQGLTGNERAVQVEKEQRIIKHFEKGEEKHAQGKN